MNIKKRVLCRGQITPFIIMGLILLVLFSIIFYFEFIVKESKINLNEADVTGPKIESALSLYIRQCIEKEGREPMIEIARQGGTLVPVEPNVLYYKQEKLSYLCYAEGLDPAWKCVNSMLTTKQMEHELSIELKRRLKSCIDLSEFSRFADVKSGELNVDVVIAKDDALVTLDYPINLTSSDFTVSISRFTGTLDYPLGRLYSIAENIVNKEITDSYFDIDSWMSQYGDVIIEKHRPYPDTVYSLKMGNYTFQFAIQDLPSVGQAIPEKKNYYGCCIDSKQGEGQCFRNTDPLRCVEVEGDYNPNVECGCGFSYERAESCKDSECNNCESAGKMNGESWCVYDTMTGQGKDYVGSRHYKYSCINGTVLIEECRDYREELCTETKENGASKAACKPNRWDSCPQCTSKVCCDDRRYRDCFWDSSLATDSRCIPQVPPGLRFWQNEGADVCLRGSQKMKCEGLSCPQDWIDSAAQYCYSQGDCGNYRNTEDILTKDGFYETDFIKSVNDSAYPRQGLNRNPLDNGTFWRLDLGFERKSPQIFSQQKENFNAISIYISAISNFFDELSKIDPSAYINPFVSRRNIEITDFSICNLWSAPEGNADCSACSSDLSKPCTEYKCMSIGENCRFEMKEGVPYCDKKYQSDFVGPVVDINTKAMPDYNFERDYLGNYQGYNIVEPVRPHRPFTFSISTDEDSKCTLSLTPRIGQYSLQTVFLGDNTFSRRHEITIRMPPRLVVPDKLYSAINFTSTRSMQGIVYNLKGIIDNIKNNLGTELKLYSRITGKDFVNQVQPKADRISALFDSITYDVDQIVKALLIQFDNGGYYVFFDCIDGAGNHNKNQVFVRFIVDYGYVDDEPPVIVQTDPRNNGKTNPSLNKTNLKIYTDEPAECRYDYQDNDYSLMNYSFSCPSAEYQLSPVAGGTYECYSDIDAPFDENHIYIRCADNPGTTDSYSLSLSVSKNRSTEENIGFNLIQNPESLNYTVPADYITTSPISIAAPASMIDNIRFESGINDIYLDLYLDDKKQCRYSQDDLSFEDMDGIFGECDYSDDMKKGAYRCRSKLDIIGLFNESIGNYVLNIDRTEINKTDDGDLSRIDFTNQTVKLNFNDRLYGNDRIEMNFSELSIIMSVEDDVKCSLSMDQSEEDIPMDCEAGSNMTLCKKNLSVPHSSSFTFTCEKNAYSGSNRALDYHIKCRQETNSSRNINTESYVYNISKANELVILNMTPSGVINTTENYLGLKVSEDIVRDGVSCGYNDNPYSYLNMAKSAYNEFRADLPLLEEDKDYVYYIECIDKYGAKIDRFTKFKVIK